jgi:hypothetical protein
MRLEEVWEGRLDIDQGVGAEQGRRGRAKLAKGEIELSMTFLKGSRVRFYKKSCIQGVRRAKFLIRIVNN